MLIFTDLLTPPKVYGLHTCENVDIYAWPLMYLWIGVGFIKHNTPKYLSNQH